MKVLVLLTTAAAIASVSSVSSVSAFVPLLHSGFQSSRRRCNKNNNNNNNKKKGIVCLSDAVSAETKSVLPVSSSEAEFIVKSLLQSSEKKNVFNKLKPLEVSKLAAAFESITVPPESTICKQKDKGDYFYVISKGRVKFTIDDDEVSTAGPSDAFGELALLKDGGVRAATATAYLDNNEDKENSVTLFRVHRDTFRSVLSDESLEKLGVRADFIREALSFSYVFDKVAPDQLDELIDAFEPHFVKQGQDICKQGDTGDYFYLIQSGTVKFTVDGNDVGTAGTAQTFGELALVSSNATPRAATATAYGGDVSLYRVDRDTFRSVIGDDNQTLRTVDTYSKRVDIKQKLQDAAIKSFSDETALPPNYCEDLMCQLEQIRPILRPAFHPSMNGDWCMVKAGVNTMDMTLITTLSTISRLFPFLVDFQDCYIKLSNGAALVTCFIYLKLFGVLPFKMNAFTTMVIDETHPEGTLMYERFSGASIMGIKLPLPEGPVARPLEITYLDEDIMVARNDGGEPHLLLRIKSCPEEDPNHEYTGFFETAREMYGERISRCLVDRYFGQEQDVADMEAEKIRNMIAKAKSLSVSNTRDRLRMLD